MGTKKGNYRGFSFFGAHGSLGTITNEEKASYGKRIQALAMLRSNLTELQAVEVMKTSATASNERTMLKNVFFQSVIPRFRYTPLIKT